MAVHARDQEAAAWCRVGEAELALGRHAAAAQAFAAAHARAEEVGSPYRHDASAGLARVALAEGDGAAAVQALQRLLAHGAAARDDPNLLDGVEFPRLVEWTCHRALQSVGDREGAAEWLARAHDALQKQAAGIGDVALRRAFLGNIPAHREIAAAWLSQGR